MWAFSARGLKAFDMGTRGMKMRRDMRLSRGWMLTRMRGGRPGVRQAATARAACTVAMRSLASLGGSRAPGRPSTRLSMASRISDMSICEASLRTCTHTQTMPLITQFGGDHYALVYISTLFWYR